MKIFLYYIGKARDQHANGFAEEFIKRTTRYCPCEMREIHPGRTDLWTKHPSAAKVLLDPAGRLMKSAQFIELIAKGGDGRAGPGVSDWRSRRSAACLEEPRGPAYVTLSNDFST